MSALRAPRWTPRRIRDWPLWALAEPLRSYVILVAALSVTAILMSAARLHWSLGQGAVFAGLLACGAIAVEATRSVKEIHGALSRDLQTVWYLTIAVTLPPCYAFAAPALMAGYKLWRMPRVIVYRRVFSNCTISLAYGCVSLAFHALRQSFVGVPRQGGAVALEWTAIVIAGGAVAWLINCALVLVAIKLSDPAARIRDLMGTRESLTSDSIELTLAVLLSLIVAINPVLMVLALPAVVLYRQHLMHAQLMAQTRLDRKTGVLNFATWQQEAMAELSHATRTRSPLALAMVNIDDFKAATDAAGTEVGDQLLKGVAAILRDQSRGYDLIGRVGGDEFAILLPRTDGAEARRITERLRDHIAGEPFAIESGPQAGFIFRLTVSIGVAVLNESRRALDQLIGAADTALEQARTTGWNKVYMSAEALEWAEEPGPES
ncbi:MAG: GGDEF domain-containing protein [Streptosporangiaceae bacterium]